MEKRADKIFSWKVSESKCKRKIQHNVWDDTGIELFDVLLGKTSLIFMQSNKIWDDLPGDGGKIGNVK